MPFYYPRQIRFHETDGAGVVYFANVLTLCHEAYEASLAAVGIDLGEFFSPRGTVIPIVHGAVDFFQPLGCGDRLVLEVNPQACPRSNRPLSEFSVHYRLLDSPLENPQENLSATAIAPILATATTRHVCIDATHRRRQALSDAVLAWLKQWGEDSSPLPQSSNPSLE